jgi:hypothetical protein
LRRQLHQRNPCDPTTAAKIKSAVATAIARFLVLLRNGRNCRSLLPSQSPTCVGCGRSDPIHPCLQPCCVRFQYARSPLALDPAGQAWLGWVLRELSRSFRDQRCSARRSADLTKRSSTKLPKSANTRWPATSAKCLIVRMASSSELWRIMATPQALQCEGDHFDPVIKITNCLRARCAPCAGTRSPQTGQD